MKKVLNIHMAEDKPYNAVCKYHFDYRMKKDNLTVNPDDVTCLRCLKRMGK